MKELLNDGHPLIIYTHISSFYTEPLSNGETICLYQRGNEGYHAMTIVGYDDSVCYDLNGDSQIQNYERGAFLIANSWGEDFENDGYIWVLYDALNKISNVSSLNFQDRYPVIENNAYRFINVEDYNPLLTVQVKINQKSRDTFKLFIGDSDTIGENPVFYGGSFSDIKGGSLSFDGSGNNVEAMNRYFVFDCSRLYNNNVCWLKVLDEYADNKDTLVKEIKWIKNNAVIKTEVPDITINNSEEVFNSIILINSILLSPNNYNDYSIMVGESIYLTPTIEPNNATNKGIVWSSTNQDAFTVTQSGKITCKGEGSSVIRAMSVDGSEQCGYCTLFSDDYGDDCEESFSIIEETNYNGRLDSENDYDVFKFIPSVSGIYKFFSTGQMDTYGILYNYYTDIDYDDDSGINNNFSIDYDLIAGQTYYIEVSSSANCSIFGDYILRVEKQSE